MSKEKSRRHFSTEYKKNAVKLVTEKGMSVGKVARDLDIHPNMLHMWRKLFFDKGKDAFAGKGDLKPEDEKLKRVLKELEDVKEERDILKKALSVFSKHDK
jgi:transposase